MQYAEIMLHPINTKSILTNAMIGVFLLSSIVFFTYLQHSDHSSTSQLAAKESQQKLAEAKHQQQEKIIKQRIAEDFEQAFENQYTPPVGCESWNNEANTTSCIHHKSDAKKVYEKKYLTSRGFPKETFEEVKSSYKN